MVLAFVICTPPYSNFYIYQYTNTMLNFDIYNQNSQFKIVVGIIMVLIGSISFYYTSLLVKRLEDRELLQLKNYAMGLRYFIENNNVDGNTNYVLMNVVQNNKTIPVIVTDAQGEPTGLFQNIDIPNNATAAEEAKILKDKVLEMKAEHPAIVADLDKDARGGSIKQYIYYSHSKLLTQLKYYPLIQFLVLLTFGGLGFLAFSNARRAEQNRVWVGLAKETAHQLGTPLSSLTAWVEFFKADPTYDAEIVKELEKDVQRLDMITTRFSNIGSVPTLKNENLAEVVTGIMSYLQKRISTKVKIFIDNQLAPQTTLPLNRYLFEWVIENVSKNAVDAMAGVGELRLQLYEHKKQIFIDITDTGKGIPRGQFEQVFNAGFSTKKRGWGLGLTLARRIVENYHRGKLIVAKSELSKGTTFRIALPIVEAVTKQ